MVIHPQLGFSNGHSHPIINRDIALPTALFICYLNLKQAFLSFYKAYDDICFAFHDQYEVPVLSCILNAASVFTEIPPHQSFSYTIVSTYSTYSKLTLCEIFLWQKITAIRHWWCSVSCQHIYFLMIRYMCLADRDRCTLILNDEKIKAPEC